MSKLIDLTGKIFGRLTVIERAPNIGEHTAWRCRCSCGNEVIVRTDYLKRGETQSCGCLRREKSKENGKKSTKHKMTGTKIYFIWQDIKDRCENPHSTAFDNYGGRGIKVCAAWHEFLNFYADVSQMENYGRAGYSLDRIDVDGDYCPENVRWADWKTQQRNRRDNVFVEYEGVEMSMAEAAEKSGINYKTFWNRYRKGDRGEKLFRPVLPS